ncbi:MAG: hypothetical protein NC122_04950 [Faecalibacterium sp.]|nr:hypothetical protein [Ruminococcus sp.]MCM1485533.1 hypothetical protein [Faecalibacterium sp.]
MELLTNPDCNCGGEFEEAEQCRVCGEWITPDESVGSVCENCIKSNADLKTIKQYSEHVEKESVALNPLLINLFDVYGGVKRIENVLWNYLQMQCANWYTGDKDMLEQLAREWMFNDLSHFADHLPTVLDEMEAVRT